MSPTSRDEEGFLFAHPFVQDDVSEMNPSYLYPQWELPVVHASLDEYESRPDNMHYVPANAISTRYYALSSPYDYPLEQHPTPIHDTAEPVALPAATPAPQADEVAGADGFAANNTPQTGTQTRSSTPRNPVLPKQRNRDYPCGDSDPAVQPTSQPKDQSARVQCGSHDTRDAGHDCIEAGQAPSRIKLEDVPDPKGLLGKRKQREEAPQPSTSGANPDADADMPNLSAMYSPTTGRKVWLGNVPGRSGVQIIPGTTAAKRPYKRGTSVACMSCRKRKVACGGPQEGDEEGRCGRCVKRQQQCEFPASAHRLVRARRPSSGYAGPVFVQEFK
ncbi:hypothetical protein PYCCODRAFT_1440842 [Trametes coccinea BRFM310]|uniref:Zn(2)-C6 fungal-type domain-containing protein n=1 Tax=Trametes coccinea (strain BRFM310) TaxID=1353009 RepID=A0A1Y2I6I2_TRAC3|nr:hypothetical protein PYCCODRAFT_1440842 [Trametes coccinea BRFM310]